MIQPRIRHPHCQRAGSLCLLGMMLLLTGCQGPRIVPLMPTPALYSEVGVSPLDHIPEAEQWKPRKVYYATTRARASDLQTINYTNTPGERISVGLALIGFGNDTMSWSDLQEVSKETERLEPVDLSIAGLLEAGTVTSLRDEVAASGPVAWLVNDLNQSIRTSRDQDLLIYVHGAKVNFYNACAFAAQLDHFMGRDMTSMAFSWPTRQNIFAYVSGADVKRGYGAAEDLSSLLELLAAYSEARRIHLVAWSAGSRVVTTAISDLRQRYPDLSPEELSARFRIGTFYFAASEIHRKEFIPRIPDLEAVSQRVVVTASSNDAALKHARLFMGGGTRIGQLAGGLSDAEREILMNAERLEVIDLSLGSEERGFDITGHRYWFDHPWASTDLILAIRTDQDPAQRGQAKGPWHILWGLPTDYPDRLRNMAEEDRVFREPPK